MKKLLLLLMALTASTTFASVKIDITYKLMSVSQNMIINGLDENTEEGVIFITESLHLEKDVRLKIRNACLIVLGNITGTGIIDVDQTATVTIEGEKKGIVTFSNRFLADSSCQQSTGLKTFKNIKNVPQGLNYSLYTLKGRLLDISIVDDYIQNYADSKTYFIKVEGYKLKRITFKR